MNCSFAYLSNFQFSFVCLQYWNNVQVLISKIMYKINFEEQLVKMQTENIFYVITAQVPRIYLFIYF